jgi:hypothetical protein
LRAERTPRAVFMGMAGQNGFQVDCGVNFR